MRVVVKVVGGLDEEWGEEKKVAEVSHCATVLFFSFSEDALEEHCCNPHHSLPFHYHHHRRSWNHHSDLQCGATARYSFPFFYFLCTQVEVCVLDIVFLYSPLVDHCFSASVDDGGGGSWVAVANHFDASKQTIVSSLSLFLTLDFFLFVWLCGYKIITSKTIIIIIIIISSSYCNVLPTFTLFCRPLCLLTFFWDWFQFTQRAGWLTCRYLQRQQTSTNPIQSSVNEYLCMCVCVSCISQSLPLGDYARSFDWDLRHTEVCFHLFSSAIFPSMCACWTTLARSLKYNSHLGPH